VVKQNRHAEIFTDFDLVTYYYCLLGYSAKGKKSGWRLVGISQLVVSFPYIPVDVTPTVPRYFFTKNRSFLIFRQKKKFRRDFGNARAHLMLSVAVGKETHDNGPLLKLPVLYSEVVVL
jgi:hypothetical protein